MYKIRIDKYVLFSLHCTTTNMLTIITYFLVHCFCIDTKRLQKKWTLLSFPYMICCISIGLKNFKDISISIKSSFVVPVHFSMTQRYKKKFISLFFLFIFCHHFSSVVCRPFVNISHFNLLLRNHWTNCNQTLVEWSLDGPLSKLCPVFPTSNQDGRQAKNRKKGGWNFNCPLLL